MTDYSLLLVRRIKHVSIGIIDQTFDVNIGLVKLLLVRCNVGLYVVGLEIREIDKFYFALGVM